MHRPRFLGILRMVYMPDPFPPGAFTANVTVWSTKKHDRGQFNVYVGTTLLVCLPQYDMTLVVPQLTHAHSTGHGQSIHERCPRNVYSESLSSYQVSCLLMHFLERVWVDPPRLQSLTYLQLLSPAPKSKVASISASKTIKVLVSWLLTLSKSNTASFGESSDGQL